MRAFTYGRRFDRVTADVHVPSSDDIDEMRADLSSARVEGRELRIFTEEYLYPRLGKDDARFVLAVVDEYERLIKALGEEKVRQLLGKRR